MRMHYAEVVLPQTQGPTPVILQAETDDSLTGKVLSNGPRNKVSISFSASLIEEAQTMFSCCEGVPPNSDVSIRYPEIERAFEALKQQGRLLIFQKITSGQGLCCVPEQHAVQQYGASIPLLSEEPDEDDWVRTTYQELSAAAIYNILHGMTHSE